MKRLPRTTVAVVAAAVVELEGMVERAQEYFDSRSQSWREGDRGAHYQVWIDRLEETLEALKELPVSPDER